VYSSLLTVEWRIETRAKSLTSAPQVTLLAMLKCSCRIVTRVLGPSNTSPLLTIERTISIHRIVAHVGLMVGSLVGRMSARPGALVPLSLLVARPCKGVWNPGQRKLSTAMIGSCCRGDTFVCGRQVGKAFERPARGASALMRMKVRIMRSMKTRWDDLKQWNNQDVYKQ